MSKKTYKIGIIGFGMIGKVHAFAYRTLPFFCDPVPLEAVISHIVTLHPETAEKAKRIAGAEHAGTDFREITENPEIDIVHICTPNAGHLPALVSAIRNGKHIYCEKPLAVDLDEAETVIKAIEESAYDRTSQMCFHLRFYPAIQRAKRLINEGKLGRILQFRISYLHSSNVDPKIPFRWKHAAGGGVLLDTGAHIFDLLDMLLGPVDSLIADSFIAVPERPAPGTKDGTRKVEVEDSITMLARMQNGARGTLEATKLATGSEDELRLEIHGSLGAVRFNLMRPHFLEFFDAGSPERPLGGTSGWLRINCGNRYEPPETEFPSAKSAIGWTRAHIAALTNFLQAVAENRPACPDIFQGYKIQRFLDLASRSARENRWISAMEKPASAPLG